MCNLSIVSQLLRTILGLVMVVAAWYGPQTDILAIADKQYWLIGWFGLVPLISGIAAFCPLYAVFGCGHKHKENKPE